MKMFRNPDYLGAIVPGKLPTYPFPKPTLTLTSHLRQNVGLVEGRWTVSQKRIMIPYLNTNESFLRSTSNFSVFVDHIQG